MWSLGVLLYLMIVGKPPFVATTSTYLYKKINRGQFSVPKWLSSDAKALFKMLLHVNPDERCNAEDICRHSWLPVYDEITLEHHEQSSLFVAQPEADAAILDQVRWVVVSE